MRPPDMDNSPRGAKQERLRHIIRTRRTYGAESDWSATLGEAARSLGVRPTAPPLSNLSDPAEYPEFSGQALDNAASPHKSKHYVALGSDICNESKSWDWTCERITADDLHPEWIHRRLFDQSGILFADLFRNISGCRLPFCVSSAMAT